MSEEKKFYDTEKQKKALDKLNEKWRNKICEVCGAGSWTLAEDLVMPMPFTGGGLTIGGPSYPQ